MPHNLRNHGPNRRGQEVIAADSSHLHLYKAEGASGHPFLMLEPCQGFFHKLCEVFI